MLLQYLDTLKALGASPSTKYVLPLELTELAQRLGRFVDASGDEPPGDGSTGGVRRLPRVGGPAPEVRPPTAMSASMGTEGGLQRVTPPAPPPTPPTEAAADDAPTEPNPDA
jgi:hypothetical protein